MRLRVPLALTAVVSLVMLASCQQAPTTPPPASPSGDAGAGSALGDGHGAIAGAEEIAEPALHLASVDPAGTVHHLDLVDGTSAELGDIPPLDTLDSDGRFLFAGREGGVSIVDSGVWTWNHIDHFHYYRAPAAVLGDLAGDGHPSTITSDLGAGVYFDGGEAVLLDHEALKAGEIVESFRIDVPAGTGIVVPLPTGALVADGDELRHLGADGDEIDTVACAEPAGSIATNVGVVVGCADGAVLATTDADGTRFERIPYPAGTTDRALSFAAREGRPTVAGSTGGSSFWLLDTRERSWTRVDAGEDLARVSAVDDADEHVVALTADGSVAVFSGATGERLSRTQPLVAASLADPGAAAGVTLVVDPHRTYLNAPAESRMYEIDVADGARIARTFEAPHIPAQMAGTGR